MCESELTRQVLEMSEEKGGAPGGGARRPCSVAAGMGLERMTRPENSCDGVLAKGIESMMMCASAGFLREWDWKRSRFHRKAQAAQVGRAPSWWMAIAEERCERHRAHHCGSEDCPTRAEQSGKRRDECVVFLDRRRLLGLCGREGGCSKECGICGSCVLAYAA